MRQRLFCPVIGCPCSDPTRTAGWTSKETIRSHIDAHLGGALAGEVPAEWLQAHNRQRCSVCGLSVSTRHGVHPTCRPAAREASGPAAGSAGAAPAGIWSGPSFADLLASRTTTLRHVPAAARHAWSQALSRALAAVAHSNTEHAWRQLFLLPQCVLCPPPRGGRKHRKAAGAYTRDRAQRWLEGERQFLWESRHMPARRGGRAAPSDEERRRLATALTREGCDGKACAALLSKGLSPETAATAEELRMLHPSHPAPRARSERDLPASLDIDADAVARALRAFPAGTAPGPSGLRAQHLLDASAPGVVHDGFLRHLTDVVNLLAQGAACNSVAPYLAGAALVAVPKPKGGVRPIAIGEVLRRLTGKCLAESVREDAKAFFWPVQLGVAVPSGVEVAVHAVRSYCARQAKATDRVLVKLDFENAFNTISRDAVLTAVTEHFPHLARWVHWCYRQPSHLLFGAFGVQSAAGVQQGDPLGPLLFACVLQSLGRELKAGPLDLAVFYLDDGVIAGTPAAVGQALRHVQQRAAEVGLRLNLRKCEAVAVGATTADSLTAHLPREILFGASGEGRVARNFELLGAAVGDDDYTAAHTHARCQAAVPLLDAISGLEDPQVGLRLLRACAGHARLVHGMRCTPPKAQLSALEEFDALVQGCFSSLTGLRLTAEQVRQTQRGLALRSAARDAPAAYLASLGGSILACADLDPSFEVAAVPQPSAEHALQLPDG